MTELVRNTGTTAGHFLVHLYLDPAWLLGQGQPIPRSALREGRSKDGRALYPAFPYPQYTRVTDEDADAIFAFLRSLPAVGPQPVDAQVVPEGRRLRREERHPPGEGERRDRLVRAPRTRDVARRRVWLVVEPDVADIDRPDHVRDARVDRHQVEDVLHPLADREARWGAFLADPERLARFGSSSTTARGTSGYFAANQAA